MKLLPDSDADAWVLVSENPLASDHRDAYLGNGLLGLRVNPWGDGSDYRPGSCSFMAGFWGESARGGKRPEALAELPHWATLRIGAHAGQRRDHTRIEAHKQELDLRTATVRTRYRSEGPGGAFDIEREIWLARADKHLAVLAATVMAGAAPVHLYVEETLDASAMPDLADPVSDCRDGDLVLSCSAAKLGRRLAIASAVSFEGLEARRVWEMRVACHGPLARRWWRIALAPGTSVRIVKQVALVADRHAADPLAEARRQVATARADPAGLRARHEAAWAALWRARVETDHKDLQRMLNAFLYQLYATLRADEPFSHGPCGLSCDGWDGTIFWDTDLWTLPIYALFAPELAMACARYRHATLPGALANARERGERGARYAWQSAATGRECCTRPVFQDERHIVSCVARGQWVAAMAAGDSDYLRGPGLDVIRACAEYWTGRVTPGDDGRFHILHVCGPDEDAGYVDDNAMTNWSAAWTLRLADRLSRAAERAPDPRWTAIADAMFIPWDTTRDIPLQMAGWRHGQTIKQADAVLLAYPWDYPLDDAARTRLVDYYRQFYPKNQIMMGVAMDGIIDCRLGRTEQAWRCVESMLAHVRGPYLLVSESPANETISFLTGIGGFLQLVCMGFAGIRAESDEPMPPQPCLPPEINFLCLRGIRLQGRNVDLTVRREGADGAVSLSVTDTKADLGEKRL